MYSKGNHNDSTEMLKANKSNGAIGEVDPNDLYHRQRKRAKRENLSHLYKNDYKPAKYSVACEYRDALSYKKKMSNGTYVNFILFRKNQSYFKIQMNSKCLGWDLIFSLSSREELRGCFSSQQSWKDSGFTSTLNQMDFLAIVLHLVPIWFLLPSATTMAILSPAQMVI